jgi:hypothetical protein
MSLQQFNKLPTDNDHLNRVQENIRIALDPISTDIIFNRQEIEAVVSTSNTKINHNLRRTPKGFIIIDKTAVGDVHRVNWDNQSITLISSANTIIKFWLF